MKKYILFSLIFLISFKLVQSQNYFPLHVGDKFIYFYYYNQWWTGGGTSGSYKTIMKIKKDSIINNKKYFYCEGFPTGIGNVFIRLDSISKNLLRFDSSNSCSYYNYEKLIDSLKMDSIYCYENACSNWFLFSKGIDTLFGQASNFKFFTSGSTIPNYVREFKANFGLIRFEDHIFQGTFSGRDGYGNLIGCLINGIIYGDTTV